MAQSLESDLWVTDLRSPVTDPQRVQDATDFRIVFGSASYQINRVGNIADTTRFWIGDGSGRPISVRSLIGKSTD
jgi:hypothetical protein